MNRLNTENLRRILAGGARILCENSHKIDELNVFPVPDGDTGSNMCRTLEKMVAALAGRYETPKQVAESAARGALLGARGNSGVILSQVLKGFAEGLPEDNQVGAIGFATALSEAADAAYQAVIKPVEGTILTVLKDSATAAELSVSEPGTPVSDILDAALLQAKLTLKRTPQMLDKLREAGVVDAGGQGLVHFFEGMLLVMQGELHVSVPGVEEAAPKPAKALDYMYCTEIIVSADAAFATTLKERLLRIPADSLIVVGDGGAVKVHIHTNEPGKVITMGLEGGDLLDIKIDNMARQHREHHLVRPPADDAASTVDTPDKHDNQTPEAIAGPVVISVADGEGLKEIFMSLGVHHVIDGGQTMNPSIEDFCEAMQGMDADAFILLPNNSNIVPAAEKAAQLIDVEVYVVYTENVPQGFTAMMEYQPGGDARAVSERMQSIIGTVTVAEITTAVRSVTISGKNISKGDVISIIDGDIRFATETIQEALMDTLELFAAQDSEVISIYRGDGLEEHTIVMLIEEFESKYPNIEIESHYGGQKHYPLLVSAE